MSTHAPTTDETESIDEHETAPTETPSIGTQSTETPPTEAETAETRDRAPPDGTESWVAQCRSQFDADSTDRLRNLADGENAYVGGSH